MDIIGRSYMLITSGNLRVNGAMNTIGSITSRCSGIRAHAPSPEPTSRGGVNTGNESAAEIEPMNNIDITIVMKNKPTYRSTERGKSSL